MTSNNQHDTAPDRRSGRTATGHARPVAAREAPAARRQKQADRDAEFRRRIFVVANGTDRVKLCGPLSEVLANNPDAFEPQ